MAGKGQADLPSLAANHYSLFHRARGGARSDPQQLGDTADRLLDGRLTAAGQL